MSDNTTVSDSNDIRAVVPKINIENNNGNVRLRFNYCGTTYRISGIGRFEDKLSQAKAGQLVGQIKGDILHGCFDPTLKRYDLHREAKEASTLEREQKSLKSLQDVWTAYCEGNKNRVQHTTQKVCWRNVQNALSKLTSAQLEPQNAKSIVQVLLVHYSSGSLKRILQDLQAASNWALEQGLIDKSYWSGLVKQLPAKRRSPRSKQAFTTEECEHILEAFRSDKYCSPNAWHKHSHYACFVEFLLLTGCRPEDAIALRYADIKDEYIEFSKAYSKGILKGTKNEKIRRFPINEQLRECLESQKLHSLPSSPFLLFPSAKGKYIDLHNFTSRIWRVVLTGCVTDGLVKQYLPTYNLRNTSASFYLRKGVDPSTIAYLLETSEAMLNKHYFSPDSEVKLPEI